MLSLGLYGVFLSWICATVMSLNSQPILKLYQYIPDPLNIIRNSDALEGLVHDTDLFKIRGKVNLTGEDHANYKDVNIFLQANQDINTDIWITYCRVNLNACGRDLTQDCHCESKDEEGFLNLMLPIRANSIYTKGALRLSMNDKINPSNSPEVSNVINYYPGTICEQKKVTLKTGETDMVLDKDPSSDTYKDFALQYQPEMKNLTFCVFNLETIEFIQIEEGEEVLAKTTTDPCVTIFLTEERHARMLTMSFKEYEAIESCGRSGSYTLNLNTPIAKSSGLEAYRGLRNFEIAVIVCVFCLLLFLVLISIVISSRCKKRNRNENDSVCAEPHETPNHVLSTSKDSRHGMENKNVYTIPDESVSVRRQDKRESGKKAESKRISAESLYDKISDASVKTVGAGSDQPRSSSSANREIACYPGKEITASRGSTVPWVTSGPNEPDTCKIKIFQLPGLPY